MTFSAEVNSDVTLVLSKFQQLDRQYHTRKTLLDKVNQVFDLDITNDMKDSSDSREKLIYQMYVATSSHILGVRPYNLGLFLGSKWSAKVKDSVDHATLLLNFFPDYQFKMPNEFQGALYHLKNSLKRNSSLESYSVTDTVEALKDEALKHFGSQESFEKKGVCSLDLTYARYMVSYICRKSLGLNQYQIADVLGIPPSVAWTGFDRVGSEVKKMYRSILSK